MVKKTIPINKIGSFCSEEVSRWKRAVVLEADKLVKEGSPVDTGRFAVSWQIGEDDASGEPAPIGNYSVTNTVPKGSNYIPGNEKLGLTYSIHNNLPYAERLCYQGWSKQNDPNWFEMVAKEMENISKQFWNSIVKSSN